MGTSSSISSSITPSSPLPSHHKMTKKKAVVLISHGTEEMEAVITIDVLRRASVRNSDPLCGREKFTPSPDRST